MNAGAYEGEMSQVLTAVSALNTKGELRTFYPEEMAFGYRSSIFQKGDWIVVSALMKLSVGKREQIEARMKKICPFKKRKATP